MTASASVVVITTLPLAGAAEGKGLSKLWARRKIGDAEVAKTMRQMTPEESDGAILKLALEHRLVTRLTSLVAVDKTPRRPDGEPLKLAELPINLPAGWDFDKVFGEPDMMPLPAKEREAMKSRQEKYAALAAAKIAAAPTAKAAGILAADVKAVDLPGAATTAELQIWIGLLLLALGAFGMVMVVRGQRPAPQAARMRT